MTGTVKVAGRYLVFDIKGADRIFAIKSQIKVPLTHVKSVSTKNMGWRTFKQIRVGGTGLSGVIKAGRFLSKRGYSFYVMHDPSRCVTVELDHESYRQIVFQVDDKKSTARIIAKAIAGNKKT